MQDNNNVHYFTTRTEDDQLISVRVEIEDGTITISTEDALDDSSLDQASFDILADGEIGSRY